MDRLARGCRRDGGQGASALHPVSAPQARAPAPGRPSEPDPDPLHQHDQPRAGALLPRRRGDGASRAADDPLERAGDGAAREHPLRGHRRPPLDVRERREPLRGRVQPLLPRIRRRPRRPDLLPGPRGAGHLRPRLPRGAPDRGEPRPLPARVADAERRALELPASAADARLLAVPDGQHGPRADGRGLPGPLQPLPRRSRHRRHERGAGVGLRRRRRDGRARGGRCAEPGGARGPRQPHLRRELQPPAPRRTGSRQRQGHPGARGDLPRRRLERDQGHLGARVGRPAGPRQGRRPAQQDERDARRRLPAPRRERRRHDPRDLLRAGSAPAPARRAPDR